MVHLCFIFCVTIAALAHLNNKDKMLCFVEPGVDKAAFYFAPHSYLLPQGKKEFLIHLYWG
jgi:hypothetical protein